MLKEFFGFNKSEKPHDPEILELQKDAQERAEANVDPETDREIENLSKESEEAEIMAQIDERIDNLGKDKKAA